MRFLLNFFFFGLLFYLIYLFFPEAFNTLVSWAAKIYEFFRDLILQLSAKMQSGRPIDHTDAPRSLLLLISYLQTWRSSL